ncbi:MAG: methionyl-tRNA formyltransferase [Clostridia bacterium]|nr:methionyl-tRNA formyltransferase [Clostridia bacterium]
MSGFEVIGVITNPDRQKDRGMKLTETEVKKFAISKNLKIYQPEKIKGNTEFIEEIKSLSPDVICVVAYGKILPKEVLDIPPLGCINLHASLLPKYRGAAPIQWAILNGDKQTGNSTMYMNERMDEGDIIFQEKVEIGEYETTGELWERLKVAGAELLVKTLQEIEKGTAPRTPQGKYFTLAPMLKKEMAKIDFSKTATQIKNKVCGLNPIMGAYGIYQGKKIKFWKIQILNDDQANMIGQKNNLEAKVAGEVILSNDKIGLYIKAGSGIIKLTEVQGENAKRMNICDFLRGNKIEEGTKFE